MYYKVVRKMNRQMYSAITKGKARVRYITGQFVTPRAWLAGKKLGLVVFNDLDKAIDWATHRTHPEDLAIYECEIESKKRTLPARLLTCILSKGVMEKAPGGYSEWPEGTIMCGSVKLGKRVWNSEY
jgi:hypothetical protein